MTKEHEDITSWDIVQGAGSSLPQVLYTAQEARELLATYGPQEEM